ncbi:type II toxin-antitoxin system RelE/ParE family toxin [Hyphobacterium sp. CCMP332]|uniref:type II toxin-antitoxin system RelE/ParE family toxin n=1 Tax=Hyphobacterium sp. CCMP332 TaxID=2749086 RepID=UPI00165002AA|nr:type II toxin-antitoxin system RelE/ParE family toxin [Hyphobacterium sp. CCMP332]QNL18406.1 type II toxin-antitoxin system RelE/ParE family toxin [Hyphobacterium sp. CCMP332]
MALVLEITPLVAGDLKDIAFYSDMNFGFAATDAYRAGLQSAIARLLDFPAVGTELKIGFVRRISFRSHVIYYQKVEDRLLILRVLHGSQLPQLHL